MSSVTHELRTPLTSIRALSEMMLDDPDIDVEDRQRFLGIIVSETGAPVAPGQPGARHGQDRIRSRRVAQPDPAPTMTGCCR
jgi:signal transduction histidine kinase